MTKYALILAALASSAAAFAPVSVSNAKTSLNAFAGGMVGSEGPEPMPPPIGTSKEFDPLGLSTRAPEWLPWFREAELKNGRVAMLAVAGMIVPEFVRIPGEQFSFQAIPQVIQAHDALPESMIQIFGWISFLETCSWGAYANMNEFDREPGNFGFDPLGLYPKEADKQKEMQLKELKNGRLAMIAIGGMVTQAAITGGGFPYIK